MAGRAVEVSADAKEFVALFGRTSTVDKTLQTALRRRIRDAAKQAAAASKAEVLKPPAGSTAGKAVARTAGARGRSRRRDQYGGAAHGLRQGIAKGIGVQIASGATGARVGVFIRSKGSGLNGSRKKLVRRWDQGSFRHRVFGRDVWVTQAGRPYFASVIRGRASDIEAAVRAAVDEAKAHVAGRSTAL